MDMSRYAPDDEWAGQQWVLRILPDSLRRHDHSQRLPSQLLTPVRLIQEPGPSVREAEQALLPVQRLIVGGRGCRGGQSA